MKTMSEWKAGKEAAKQRWLRGLQLNGRRLPVKDGAFYCTVDFAEVLYWPEKKCDVLRLEMTEHAGPRFILTVPFYGVDDVTEICNWNVRETIIDRLEAERYGEDV